jgi:hypothetical protein
MFYKLDNSIDEYISTITGEPCGLQECSWASTPEGLNYGWVEFDTKEDAMTFFELREKTDAEKAEINEAVQYEQGLLTLDELKTRYIDKLETSYRAALASGYTNDTFNITLAIEEKDRLAFGQLLTMLKLAEDLHQTVGNQSIADINGNLHSLSVANLKALMLYYGVYYQTLWSRLNTKRNAINEATNYNEVIQNAW